MDKLFLMILISFIFNHCYIFSSVQCKMYLCKILWSDNNGYGKWSNIYLTALSFNVICIVSLANICYIYIVWNIGYLFLYPVWNSIKWNSSMFVLGFQSSLYIQKWAKTADETESFQILANWPTEIARIFFKSTADSVLNFSIKFEESINFICTLIIIWYWAFKINLKHIIDLL